MVPEGSWQAHRVGPGGYTHTQEVTPVSKITATVADLEETMLALPEPERARLAGSLVRSLTPGDEAIWQAWLDEAERRDREMGDDPEAGVPAEEVLREARSRLG